MPLSLVHQIFSHAWRVLVILGCCNKNTRLDGLHYVNLFLIDLEARNPRSRFFLADLVSGESSLPGVRMAAFYVVSSRGLFFWCEHASSSVNS